MADHALSNATAYHGRERAHKATPAAVRKRLMELIDSENIAEDMDDEERGRLGEKVLREFQVDIDSRSDWQTANDEAMKLAKQVVEEKNFPWPKAANIKFPLLTVAAIQFAARAYPAIISGPDVVKGRVRGNDDGVPLEQEQLNPGPEPLVEAQPESIGLPPAEGIGPEQAPEGQERQWQVEPGAKKARAERVARHMSYQLLDEMEEWEEETDKLLHILPIVGCVFRKTYFSPALGRNVSELVLAEDFVVNYNTKSLVSCPRSTHIVRLYPHEIEERIRDGRFIEFDTGQPAGSEPNDEDSLHDFLEQHRLEDMDDDGYPEPYIVTIHKETGKVVRVVARFDDDSITFDKKERVVRIEGEQYFTKFGFIPAFDGGFYDIGFGSLLRPMSEAINGSINRMLDAGTLQNMPGGFIGSGMRIKGGDSRFRPGELKRVTSVGGAIKDNIVLMEWPGPSPTLFQLLGLLIEAARDITSVKDIMTGDKGPAGEGAARTMARIEQGMKVFSAIYKRLFRSLKSEFGKLFRLNRLYLEPQTYFTLLDEPEAIAPEDYNSDDLDVLPVADPNMVTEAQRMAQAQFIMEFLNDPYIDPVKARKRIFGAVGVTDADDLIVTEPPPNPEIAKLADEMEVRKREVEIKGEQVQIDGMKAEAEGERILAQVAELKSKVILNLAKAEEASDKAEIESMKVLLDTILKQGQHRLDIARDARDATNAG